MDVVTKSVEAAVSPVESDNPNGQFEVILSTEVRDRDDENLWADEWKTPLPARIHIDGDHTMSVEKTVGSAVPSINENGQLVGKGTYAGTQYAQMVRQLVNEGHINSVSVTYAERRGQKDAKPQRELLNAAFVAVPANPEALVLSSKSVKTADSIVSAIKAAIVTKFKDFGASGNNPEVSHDGMVQAIHDAAYQLGAECSNQAEADPGTDEGANKGADPKTSSTKDAGSPQESAEESTAAEPAAKAAGSAAVDESAEDAVKERLAMKARALAYLTTKQNSTED